MSFARMEAPLLTRIRQMQQQNRATRTKTEEESRATALLEPTSSPEQAPNDPKSLLESNQNEIVEVGMTTTTTSTTSIDLATVSPSSNNNNDNNNMIPAPTDYDVDPLLSLEPGFQGLDKVEPVYAAPPYASQTSTSGSLSSSSENDNDQHHKLPPWSKPAWMPWRSISQESSVSREALLLSDEGGTSPRQATSSRGSSTRRCPLVWSRRWEGIPVGAKVFVSIVVVVVLVRIVWHG